MSENIISFGEYKKSSKNKEFLDTLIKELTPVAEISQTALVNILGALNEVLEAGFGGFGCRVSETLSNKVSSTNFAMGGPDAEGGLTRDVELAIQPMTLVNYHLLIGGERVDVSEERSAVDFINQLEHLLYLEGMNWVPGAWSHPVVCFIHKFISSLVTKVVNEVHVFKDQTGDRRVYFFMLPPDEERYPAALTISFGNFFEVNKKPNLEYMRQTLPRAAPEFKKPSGKYELTVTQTRPKSAWFKGKPPHVFETCSGESYQDVVHHGLMILAWLRHYDVYYNMEGTWQYDVKVKEVKPKKAPKSIETVNKPVLSICTDS